MGLAEFGNAFIRTINSSNDSELRKLIQINATFGGGNAYINGNRIIDGWYNHVITNADEAGGVAALNLSAAGPSAQNAMLGVKIGNVDTTNASVDDWRNAQLVGNVAARYNSDEAGVVCAKLALKGWHFVNFAANNSTLRVVPNDYAGVADGNKDGTRDIEARNNYTNWEGELKTALNAIPQANRVRTNVTPQQAKNWLNLLFDCKGRAVVNAANGGSNASAIDHTNPASVPHANNDDLRNSGVVNGISINQWAVRIAWMHNAGWDAKHVIFSPGGGNNQRAMQINANFNPDPTRGAGGVLRGSYEIAVLDVVGNVANANLVTPTANNVYAVVQDTVHTTLQNGGGGNPAVSAGTIRTQEVGPGGVAGVNVNSAHIAKAKEFWEILEKLREANAAGNEAGVQINANTGAVVAPPAIEDWRIGQTYTTQQALRVLARIFASGWEMSDISLSNNDIEISAAKSPNKTQIRGSINIINNNKTQLLIDRAKGYDDNDKQWNAGGSLPVTANVANSVFDRIAVGGNLHANGDPKANATRIKEAQRLLRIAQEAYNLTKWDTNANNLDTDLQIAKNAGAVSDLGSAFRAADSANYISRALIHLEKLYKDKDKKDDDKDKKDPTNKDRDREEAERRRREANERQARSDLSAIIASIKINELDTVEKIDKALERVRDFPKNNLNPQANSVWTTDSTTQNLIKDLENKRKELTGDDKKPPTGGDDKKPPTGGDDKKPPTGGDDKKPPTGGDDKKPPTGNGDKVDHAKAKEEIDAKLKEAEVKEKELLEAIKQVISKEKDYEKLELRKVKSVSEALEKFSTVSELNKFKTRLFTSIEKREGKPYVGFFRMKNPWLWVSAFALVAIIGAAVWYFFMRKPSDKQEGEEEE